MILLSVIVPFFNGQRFLRACVESIRREKIAGIEIILVDDASSSEICPEISGVVVLRRQANGGPPAAMNTGIRAARGKYIAFLDQDDQLFEGGLRARLEWLEENPGESAVLGEIHSFVDENGDPINSPLTGMEVPREISKSLIERGNYVPPTQGLYMYRRRVFDEVGLFDESLRVAFDREFLCRLLEVTLVKHIPLPVLNVRYHRKNYSVRWDSGRAMPSRRALAEMYLLNQKTGFRI